MFQWKNLLGPIPVFALIAILISAVTTSIPKLESGLQLEAQKILSQTQNNWAKAQVEGLSLTLVGVAPLPEFKDEVKNAMATIGGIEAINDITTVAPAVKPYVFTAKRDAKMVVLEGAMPSRAVKSQILEHIRTTIPNTQVQDNSRFATGVGDAAQWFKGVYYAIAQLARLETGQVQLTDGTLDIEGITQTAEKYDTLKTALKVLPESVRLNKNAIAIMRPENYEFSASRVGGVVTLKGFIPSEAARKTFTESLAKSISNVAVTDELRVAEGAPQNFTSISTAAVQVLSATSGEFAFTKSQMSVKASPQDYEIYTTIISALKPLTDAGVTTDLAQLVVPQKSLAPLTIAWDGKILKLAGEVPNEKLKEFIDQQSQLNPDIKIENSTAIKQLPSKADHITAIRHIFQATKWSKSIYASVDDAGLNMKLIAADSVAYTIATQYFAQPLGIKLTESNILAPVLKPYFWSLQKEGTTLELTGFVPSKELRSKFLELARATAKGTSIIDTMNFASTILPEADFTASVQFAMELSKFMKKTTISYTDMALSISGQAITATDLQAARALLTKLPQGVSVKTIAIEPPASASFFWRIEKQNASLQLSGAVRHEHDQNELAKALAATGLKVNGSWGLEGGAPVNFQDLTKQAIRAIATLQTAVIEIRGLEVKVVADMDSALLEAKLRKNFNALISPKHGIKLTWDVRVNHAAQLSAIECEGKVQALLKGSNSAFTGLQISMDPKFTPIMPQIADVLSRCPQATFNVIAAAPQNGGEEFAQEIAIRRARMLAVALVREGIGESRLRLMPEGMSARLLQDQSIQFKALQTL